MTAGKEAAMRAERAGPGRRRGLEGRTASRTRTRIRLAAAAVMALSTLAACTSMGMGGGELTRRGQPDEPVLFSWKSNDGGISGAIVGTLPDATYQGRFFQITRQSRREVVAPLWDGWPEGWSDWPFPGGDRDGPYEWTQFVTRYTGKVLANLQTDAGKRMRCRLQLAKPAQGMAGGGAGECKLEDGAIIHARF